MGYPHSTVVYNSVVGYTTVEKNFSGPPPHFGMTPPKSGRVLAKCEGVLTKLLAALAKNGPSHLQTRGDALGVVCQQYTP